MQFLLAIDAAARAAGVQWRALYNDYAVAAAVNRHLDRKHVIFIGQIRRGRRLGLNWHGPLLLHFHLDIAPQSQGADSEEASPGFALPEQAEELELVDPTAEYSAEALGDLETAAVPYAEVAGEYALEDQWVAPGEQLDGSEALDCDEEGSRLTISIPLCSGTRTNSRSRSPRSARSRRSSRPRQAPARAWPTESAGWPRSCSARRCAAGRAGRPSPRCSGR